VQEQPHLAIFPLWAVFERVCEAPSCRRTGIRGFLHIPAKTAIPASARPPKKPVANNPPPGRPRNHRVYADCGDRREPWPETLLCGHGHFACDHASPKKSWEYSIQTLDRWFWRGYAPPYWRFLSTGFRCRGGSTPSQSDVWALARCERALLSIAVEGKAAEMFGPTLGAWLREASAGKRERYDFIRSLLALSQPLPDDHRYFVRTASAYLSSHV
jgi:hypothetical protein